MSSTKDAVDEAPTKELTTTAPAGEVDKPASMDDLFQQDAGGGMQNYGANDLATPFLAILQKGSPQVSRANAKYIKGAEQGMILNTLTGDVYPGEGDGDEPGGILFIPCAYQKVCVRWKSRESGGGFVGNYRENDPALKAFATDERNRRVDAQSGDIIVDTAHHYGMLLHENGFPEFAVISMASTQLKKSRNWNTMMRRIMKKTKDGRIYNPPCYSHVYRLTTVGESKDTFDWYGWKIVSEGEVTDPNIYMMAREFSKQVDAGNVRVSAPPQDFEEEPTTTSNATFHDGAEGVPF